MNQFCIGYDLRLTKNSEQFNDITTPLTSHKLKFPISGDPRILERTDCIQELIDNNPWEISNPLGLLISENIANILLQKFPESSIFCFTASKIIVKSLTDAFGPGWLENLPTESKIIKDGWIFCGFDVIDLRGLFSGLYGCGAVVLIKEFASNINKFGLFSNCNIAFEFAEAQGFNIPSHAPFVVTGVFMQEAGTADAANGAPPPQGSIPIEPFDY